MVLKIALMRSVVIGEHRVKMVEARRLVEQAGGSDVRSPIATGNLLFRSQRAPADLERELEAACARFYGRATELVVRTAQEWRALLAANPFPREAREAPARLLVWAMRTPFPDAGLEQLRRRARGAERVERTTEGDLYVWFGDSPISASKIPAGFGLRALGTVGTNRNWNTAVRIEQALATMEE